MKNPISQYILGTKDTEFGKACANSYALELAGVGIFYECLFKPFLKKVLPIALAIYFSAGGLTEGRTWLSENTEFGKKLDKLEKSVSNSNLFKSIGEAGSAIGNMR